MPEFLTGIDSQKANVLRLEGFSGRIASLLLAHEKSQTGLLACLDDLLGAVYNLFYAVHYEYADRPQPLSGSDIGNVVVRATDMSKGKIRIEGKWTAGVFFNNALFRLAGLYHRTLKIASGNPTIRKDPHELMPKVQQSYQALKGSSWKHKNIGAIYREVNGLKHKSEGIALGRNVRFSQALESVHELLLLIEILCH